MDDGIGPVGRRSRMIRRTATVLAALMPVAGCAFGPQRTERLTTGLDVEVRIVDERGDPVTDAVLTDVGGSTYRADFNGEIELSISRPVAGVITAPRAIPEPVALAPRDRAVTVRLLDRDGPNGERSVLHFGGDTMLGRRYQEPIRDGTARATDQRGARRVVSDLAPVMAAADATIVNLETVVGDLPVDEAYPGKIFLVQSPPLVTAALDELGVDLVTLGNNHAYDWRDDGVRSTLAVLDGAGIAHVGAALDESAARRGTIIDAGALSIGVISVTTVDGDPFNDLLPARGAPLPADSPSSRWQYELRTFGFGRPGEPGYIPRAERVASEAWADFRAIEPNLSPERVAEVWAALTAPGSFPELQDWVARRGHGGAGWYDAEAVRSEVARLRAAGADVVVVQFHGGFQFVPVTSPGLRYASRVAIDAGADLVVSHHPHVLQGVEWYHGKLIAYSMGNLLFDQNFHLTYPSAVLRVVVDETGLVEARFLPIMLDDYRPVPAAGETAERIVRLLASRSRAMAVSARVEGLDVTSVLLDELPDGMEPASVELDRNSGLIGHEPSDESVTLSVGDRGSVTLPPCLQIRADELPSGVDYGVDLFAWGSMNDGTADRARGKPVHWRLPDNPDDWAITQGASPDPTDDALLLLTNANRRVDLRNRSLIPVSAHRVWLPDRSAPADATATYSVSVDLRRVRGEQPILRVAAYRVADEDLTREPDSSLLREISFPLDIADDDQWRRLEIELPPSLFEPVDGEPVDGLFVFVETPPAFRGSLAVDNLRVVEWRARSAADRPVWTEIDAVRASTQLTFEVTGSGCGSV